MSHSAGSNTVELNALKDGALTHVNLYIGFAEVTRSFDVDLKQGDNQIVISGLPTVLVDESLRVEGKGACTIHEVSVSTTPTSRNSSTWPTKGALLKEKERVQKALSRCQKIASVVDSLSETLDAKHVGPHALPAFNSQVLSVGNTLDGRVIELEEKLLELEAKISQEDENNGAKPTNDLLIKRVSITLDATKDEAVNLTIIYGVSSATWSAAYDIYVAMDKEEKPANLIYKAVITQSTGEDWKDVSLVLETSEPTFGHSIPDLAPWTLSIRTPPVLKSLKKGGFSGSFAKRKKESRKGFESGFSDIPWNSSDSEDGDGMPRQNRRLAMRKRQLQVTSKGNVTATFTIPGFITVPSDNTPHNVTIQQLDLDAIMSWMAVPKKEAKAHLMAKIMNDSEYTFLDGPSSVYVDGSFISRSKVPNVSPQESFDCPLGIDPTIRITYHPVSKKTARTSTLTRKLATYEFQQRITIHNTKPSTKVQIKVLDQAPVSENADIVVNLTSPKLTLAQPGKKGQLTAPEPVHLSNSITAQWQGAEEDIDPSVIGKDGALQWDCELAAQEKANVVLAWDVTCTPNTTISGLHGVE